MPERHVGHLRRAPCHFFAASGFSAAIKARTRATICGDVAAADPLPGLELVVGSVSMMPARTTGVIHCCAQCRRMSVMITCRGRARATSGFEPDADDRGELARA